MANKKPTYKLSASLINSILNYYNYPTDKNLEQIKDYINGKFTSNEYTNRGSNFEDRVFSGEYGKFSQVVMDLQRNVWYNKYVEFQDFNIYLSGKLDAVDLQTKRAFDIKRVNKYKESSYEEHSTLQHIYYFFLVDEIEHFFYLIAEKDSLDNEKEGLKFSVIHKLRPSEEELKHMVIESIKLLITFLHKHNLWDIYKENQKFTPFQKRRYTKENKSNVNN